METGQEHGGQRAMIANKPLKGWLDVNSIPGQPAQSEGHGIHNQTFLGLPVPHKGFKEATGTPTGLGTT